MSERRATSLLAAALLALLPAAASAEDRTVALGGDGALYRVVAGRHGDLFPGGPAAVAENQALAVDVTRDGQRVRLLVPGTDDPAVEATPNLVYQNSLDTAVLVWESRLGEIHSRLHLAWLRDRSWSPTIDLQSDFWSWKSSPRIALTTESYQTNDAGGAPVTHQRTVIHTLWWEDAGAGERTVYSPVVLVDGSYVGWNPVQVLDELDASEGAALFATPPALYRSPSVSPGAAPNRLIVSFVNPKTGRLLKLDVEVLPFALTDLAAGLRTYLLGLPPAETDSLQNLAEKARAHILIGGARNFNGKYLLSLANEVRRRILELAGQPSGLRVVADVARAHILIGGVEIAERALRGNEADTLSMEISADAQAGAETSAASPIAIVHLRPVASILAPRIGNGPTSIFTSASGDHTLIAWEEGGEIRYRETAGGHWTTMRSLTVGAALTRERAYEILQRRVRGN